MRSRLLLPQTGCKRWLPSRHCAPFGSNSLSQESRVGDGGESRSCLLLNSSPLLMTSTGAMGRKGQPSAQRTRSISRKTCDEDAPQLITHVETTPAPLSHDRGLSTT